MLKRAELCRWFLIGEIYIFPEKSPSLTQSSVKASLSLRTLLSASASTGNQNLGWELGFESQHDSASSLTWFFNDFPLSLRITLGFALPPPSQTSSRCTSLTNLCQQEIKTKQHKIESPPPCDTTTSRTEKHSRDTANMCFLSQISQITKDVF